MTQEKKKIPELKNTPGKWEWKLTLLFVDYEVPHYDLYAGSRTNFMYLEMLATMGLDVKFLPADFRRVEPYSTELNQLGIETLDGDWFSSNWENWLRENGPGIDYVFFHKPDPAGKFLAAVKKYTNAAIIYQCHDLHHLRLRRKAEIENDQAILREADEYERKEDYIFANSDVLLTFSELEQQFIQEKFPHKQVFTVPLFFYQEMSNPQLDFSKRQGLLYVGSCSHTPNKDAISWFCKEILPLVQQQVPDIIFNVVGADPSADILKLNSKSIRILGRVSEEELNGLYQRSRMMVVPLRFGAGVKGKVIEALYYGLPLVSTSVGLEGIPGIDHVACRQDTPESFAAEVAALYTNQKKLETMSVEGTGFVASNYTVNKTAAQMARILSVARELAASRPEETEVLEAPQTPPRLLAFYLPQYHPIPENDEWWGKGFTEWVNVAKAEPQFPGHYQPHVPADLGYYDLREEETRIAQAELAKKYGVEGFCYYHYWFNGKRLLERPFNDLLVSGKPDFPFCVCWANENWTRRWDGEDQQILMKQDYSEEDDRRHIQSLIPVFEDKRYIRINGKPLFLVYRTGKLPDPARSAEIWREEARKAGIGELYLCRVESISKGDPGNIGFDAAVEFAPDWWNKGPRLKPGSEYFGEASERDVKEVCERNYVHSYQSLANSMMAKEIPAYKWFRCVTPSWDNRARRKGGANMFLGSTPQKYKAWLTRAINNTNGRLLGEERIVFVNAWNEWAEGNHLEPDQKFGHGYLEATLEALEETSLVADTSQVGSSDKVGMSRLMSQLVNTNYRLSELEARLTQRDQEIEEFLTSTSWRLTAPLRWARQRFNDLKSLFSK